MLVLTNIKTISIQNWIGVEEKIKLIQTALIISIFLSLTRHIITSASEKNIAILILHNSLINFLQKKTVKQLTNVKIKNQFCFFNMSADRKSNSST
jgi:hypothetical protein